MEDAVAGLTLSRFTAQGYARYRAQYAHRPTAKSAEDRERETAGEADCGQHADGIAALKEGRAQSSDLDEFGPFL